MAADRPSRFRDGLALTVGAILLLYALWPWLPLSGRATPAAYGRRLRLQHPRRGARTRPSSPAFARRWQKRDRRAGGVHHLLRRLGHGHQPAHPGRAGPVAILSLELDAHRLADAGVIPAGPGAGLPHGGVVNRTPFVLLVRPGNPKAIRDFADLARPGVRVVHPDPLTSGGANWAILAEYGAGGPRLTPAGARGRQSRRCCGVWHNVVAQAASARAARTQFENGFGDVLVTYEQEVAARTRSAGTPAGRDRLPAEHRPLRAHPGGRRPQHAPRRARRSSAPWSRFLWSERAQRLFVRLRLPQRRRAR